MPKSYSSAIIFSKAVAALGPQRTPQQLASIALYIITQLQQFGVLNLSGEMAQYLRPPSRLKRNDPIPHRLTVGRLKNNCGMT
jgi:hypothetical protein